MQRIFSPQSWFLMASTALARAASFSSGATESSMSRNTMSAGRPGALPSIFSLDAGTDRQERRGRSRVRADMAKCYEATGSSRQVGGRELLADEALEAGGVASDEAAAQRQPLDVARHVGAPRGIGEELDGLAGAHLRQQRPARQVVDDVVGLGTVLV